MQLHTTRWLLLKTIYLLTFIRAHQEEEAARSAQKDLIYGMNDQLHNSRLEAPLNRVDGLLKATENNLKDSHNGTDRETMRDV